VRILLLILCLLPQDQAAEAKKLLDALAPSVKDPPYAQVEWEVQPGPSKCVGHFKRGQAWRTDNALPGNALQITVWNGKELLIYTKTARGNNVRRDQKEPVEMLTMLGGALAEIAYTGNADRLLKDASKITVAREKLEGVDCTHLTIFRKQNNRDYEHHVWIDSKNRCVRYVRKTKIQDRDSELIFTYKVIQPPTTREEMFAYQPPAEDK
jgi:outer membrane lipoprotein-sorting protein